MLAHLASNMPYIGTKLQSRVVRGGTLTPWGLHDQIDKHAPYVKDIQVHTHSA